VTLWQLARVNHQNIVSSHVKFSTLQNKELQVVVMDDEKLRIGGITLSIEINWALKCAYLDVSQGNQRICRISTATAY
jgi:hypothetical protein